VCREFQLVDTANFIFIDMSVNIAIQHIVCIYKFYHSNILLLSIIEKFLLC